ncbi:MAG: ATP-grasp domain-containing protein [Lachnospiraceae bacterium]|nr:ATP-grasp domain-containing protein [Lachnospiraceae bacterium]
MKLAIIGAGYMGKVIAERAKEMGVETHCFAWEKGAVAKPFCDYFYPISVFEQRDILKKCKEIGIDGVISASEISIITAAYVAENLGLVGNSVKASTEIRNKYYQREKTKRIEDISTIQYERIVDESDIDRIKIEFPCILKPVDGGGKVGVSVTYSEQELRAAFKENISRFSEFLVEEYIEGGKEYSVETITYKGVTYVIQLTDKVSSGPPYNVELAHHQPADIGMELRDRIERSVQKIISNLGIKNGPCHTEIKVKNNDIYLIEVNGRLGGDHIAYPLTELSTGYPYISSVIAVALGIFNPKDIKLENGGYASVYFVVEQTKYLKPILDNCKEKDWCYECNKVSNELIELKENDGFRINYFIYYSKNKRPNFNERWD